LKNTRDILDHDNIGSSDEVEVASQDESEAADGREERRAKREQKRRERKEKKENRSAQRKRQGEEGEAEMRSPMKRNHSDGSSDVTEKRKLVDEMDVESLRAIVVRHVSLEDIQQAHEVRGKSQFLSFRTNDFFHYLFICFDLLDFFFLPIFFSLARKCRTTPSPILILFAFRRKSNRMPPR
jgi:hypothetical protein